MRIVVMLSFLVLAVASCDPTGSSAGGSAADEAVRQLLAGAAEINNKADAEAFAALFTKDAIVMPQGAPAIVGREAILAGERQGNSEFASEITINPVEVVIAGDWAFARTELKGTKTPLKGGKPVPVDAKELVIFRHRDAEGWKIARLIGNTNRHSFAWHSTEERPAEELDGGNGG